MHHEPTETQTVGEAQLQGIPSGGRQNGPAPPQATPASHDRAVEHRQPPGQVPGYGLERCLGVGSYGEVWLATDQQNPSFRVAIKFFARRHADWSLLAQEVEKLSYLATDRYVVQLRTVGWKADPPYFVMEYMENGSLEDVVRAGPLPVAEAVGLFREVVAGVVNAHNRGVLHCDLKPANVLLGKDRNPRLADFGQARLAQEQTNALGTLFYMAPEQADAKAVPDARWDVYALGAILHCLLTGQPPQREAPGAAALKEAMPLEKRLALYRKLLSASPAAAQPPPRPRHRSRAGGDY